MPYFGVNKSFDIFEAISVLLTYCKLSSHKPSKKIQQIPKTSQKSFLGLHSGKMSHFASNMSFFQIFSIAILVYSYCLEISALKILENPLKLILRTKQTSFLGQN